MCVWSPVPAVDAVLAALGDGGRGVLGDRMLGLYLYGSLATGGFTPDTSDVDFVVVLRSPLSPEEGGALEALLRRLQSEHGKWALKLEGAFVPFADLKRHSAEAGPFLVVNEGQIYWAGLGVDWVIQRYTLLTYPVAVDGPPLAGLIDPVSTADLQQAVRNVFADWWRPMLTENDLLERADYRQYAVLTMCRVFRLFETGVMTSKPAAADWALQALDPRWHALIRWAQTWTPGTPAADIDIVKALIREANQFVG